MISLCTRETSTISVAEEHGTSRCNLYRWKKRLLNEEDEAMMDKFRKIALSENKDELLAEVNSLKNQIYKLQLEFDMLNKASEIKKEQGIDLQRMTNKEKTRA